jgi:DNA-binding transcriptional LysR family regulator
MYLEMAELRAFTVLASELHFRRASERLFMSQPALSRLIRRLEEQTGGPLFARTRRRVALTEAGRALLPRAEQLCRDSAEALNRVKEVAEGRAGILRIGFGIASARDILPRTILRFRKTHPHAELYLRDMSTASQIAGVARGDIDLGIVRFTELPDGTDGFPLFTERLVVAAPRSLAYNPRHGLRGLREAPFVLLPPAVSATFHEHVLSVCRHAGFTPRVVQEAGEMFTILNLVRAGLGVSLIPHSASRMNVPGVVYHELRDSGAEWRIGPVWSRHSGKLALIANFCEALRAVAVRSGTAKRRCSTGE